MIPSAIQMGGNKDMQSMDAALAELVRAGRDLTRELALNRCTSPDTFERLLTQERREAIDQTRTRAASGAHQRPMESLRVDPAVVPLTPAQQAELDRRLTTSTGATSNWCRGTT